MQLVYRAASYTCQPVAPAPLPTAIAALALQGIASLPTLLYRSQVDHYRKPVSHSVPISHTLNWEFSSICNAQDAALKTAYA